MLLKWKYYILLFAILVFLAETISIPYLVQGTPTSGPCKMRMASQLEPKKDCCKKHGNKEAQKPLNCIDCPLCCITIASSLFVNPAVPPEKGKIRYSPFRNPLLSSYHNEMWKPPDSLSVSMS